MKYLSGLFIFIIICVSGNPVEAQFRETVHRQHQLFTDLKQIPVVVNGFASEISGTTMTYTSVRDDCRDALIARATDGSMDIEWKSAPVPEKPAVGQVTFFMMAGFDQDAKPRKFDFYINGQKRFVYTGDLNGSWSVPGEGGGSMAFNSFLVDGNHDAFGYLVITVPIAWIQQGAQTVFRVEGEKAGDFIWLMIFKCPDAWSFFEKKAVGESWFDLQFSGTGKAQQIVVTAPGFLKGKMASVKVGDSEGKGLLKEKNGVCTGNIKLKGKLDFLKGKELTFIVEGVGVCTYPELFEEEKAAMIDGDLLAEMSGKKDGNEWFIQVSYKYRPGLSENLQELSESRLRDGEVHIINSSHQDIAWMDSPQQCIIDRDEQLVTPALRQLSEHPDYGHDLEDALILREYLERHPESKDEIYKFSKKGRITWGAAYNAPYEEMYAGESLVRQFYLGKRWIEKLFPGVVANTYWNVDVPGRTLQMPQILAKSGVKYMMISRHRRGVFHWKSPDGSSVVTYSSDHYAMSYSYLQSGFATAAQLISGLAREWKGYNTNPDAVAVMPVLSSTDMSPPAMYYNLIEKWNGLKRVQADTGKELPMELPVMLHSTASKFLDKMVLSTPDLKTIQGERPNVWVYIHGPSHHRALSAGREAGIWLPAAEKFATIRSLINENPSLYPRREFTKAWEAAIYPDHGWGGKNGNVTDTVFLRKMTYGKNMAKKILSESLMGIAKKIRTDVKKGYPLHVFNSLSWPVTGPVEANLTFEEGDLKGFGVRDERGEKIDMQVIGLSTYADGSVKTADVVFIAEAVPSIGYTTYYVQSRNAPVMLVKKNGDPIKKIENDFYNMDLGDGGIGQLYDKSLGQNLFTGEKFLGAEWFTMHSFGNGAGEFADIQQPDMEGFDKMSNHHPQWKVVEDGPVRTVVKFVKDVGHMSVESQLAVYHAVKRIDFKIALLNWDGTPYREFRLAFPLNMKDGQVTYEVPFGVLQVGKDELKIAAGERYVTPCENVHPRGIMNWIGASNDHFGVTISSSVAVADYIDPTDQPLEGPVIQPILLASRHSCHWEGLQFSQEGDHHYKFSLTSHKPGWEKGYKFGMTSNEPLQFVFNPDKTGGNLPESKSFFSIEGGPVVISTIKLCEDDDNVIVRFYEVEGRDVKTKIVPDFKFSGACKTDLLERERGNLKLTNSGLDFPIHQHAIESIKLIK